MKPQEDIVAIKAAHLTSTVFKFLNQEDGATRRETDVIALAFMATFLYTLLNRQLKEKAPKGLTKEQELDHVYDEYSDLKAGVQNAVAAAFQAALSDFSGKTCEYYCQVKTVPEAVNKHLC